MSKHSFPSLHLATLLVLSSVGSTAWCAEVDPTRFEKTIVSADLVQPMEFDIAPDGHLFLIELGGNLKRIDPNTGVAEVVGKLTVTTEQENGLIGLALDPNFAENGWIYLQYSPPDFPGQHISRFNFRDGQLDLASEKRLFRYQEQRRECCHHAGSLEFGPDGNLYIGTGDNTNPFNDSAGFAPLDQRPDREPWDAQRSAGNTKSYNGKILRIRPEADGSYSIPDGNLFPKDGQIGYPEIYVMGCRNPWRINLDQRTGYLYWGDVGPDAGQDNERGPRGYDEVNQARSAGNFGWPYFIGNNFAYPLVDFASGKISPPQDPASPENHSVNNTGSNLLPPAQPAMIYYPAAATDLFPEVGSGGRTACAGPVYYFDNTLESPHKFPADYDSTLFAFEWSRNWIMAVHLDADSKIQRLERFLPEMQFTRPIDIQFDARGAMYVIEYGETWGVNPDAQLVRIDYVRGNRRPTAIATAVGNVGREPLEVQLSGRESSDKDGDPLTYQWTAIRASAAANSTTNSTATSDDDPAATPPTLERTLLSTEAEYTATFEEPGIYTLELLVTDPSGANSVTSLPILVGNSRPEVEFLEPRDGAFFTPGQAVRYRMLVRDLEDGTSDFDQADEDDNWEFIDSSAPSRLTVEAVPVDHSAEASNDPPGLALIRQTDCLNCHAYNRPLVGPSFVQIATKYQDQPHQLEVSVKRVIEGSTGVWGKVAMLPHSQHTPEQVQQMVEYVFSATADNSNPSAQGFTNELPIAEEVQAVRFEANFTDLGRGDVPKLSGFQSVTLRSRQQQAEWADEYQRMQPLNSDKAQGKVFMGGIEHGGYLRFKNLDLSQISALKVRLASAGAGGMLEVHQSSIDGPLLGSVAIEVNGEWEAFYEKTIALEKADELADLFLVFKNEKNRGGLANIDAVEFLE